MSSKPFSPFCCKERHNITDCICMERRKNPWFQCDQWYCNRPRTNVSQMMHNLKRYPEFRCIASDRGCLRQQWGSHRDQHYESGINLPWMHNHHAQTIVYQLPFDCKEQEGLYHVCLSWGHFVWHVVITCLSVFAWLHNMHGKERKWVCFISVLTEKFTPNVWYILSNHLLIPLPHWVLDNLQFQAVFLAGVHPHYIAFVNPPQMDFYIR